MTNRLVILIELLLVVGLYFGYIQPTYSNSIVPLNTEISQVEAAQKSAKQYVGQEASFEGQFHSTSQQDSARLNTFLPSLSRKAHFLYDVNTLAANSGFILNKYGEKDQNVNQNGTQNHSALRTMTITLSGTGSYQSFRTFLAGLERSLRLVDVKSIKVTTATNNASTSGTKVTKYAVYSMTLTVYWLPIPKAV